MMNELHLGEPNKECAACRKPLDQKQKKAGSIRVGFENAPVNLFFEYQICADCLVTCQRGGADCEGVMAAVGAFHYGEEATQ